MEHTREAAAQLINDINLCSEAQKKADYLAQLSELLLRKEPQLLPEFLPALAQLQVDSSALVRKTYLSFLTQAVDSPAGEAVLPQACTAATACLRDTSPLVVRAAMVASSTVLRVTLAYLSTQPTKPELLKSWEEAKNMLAVAGSLLQSPTTQEGLKLAAVKVVETAALLLSHESAPALPGAEPNAVGLRMPLAADMGSRAAAQITLLHDLVKKEPGAGAAAAATPAAQAAARGKGPMVIAAVKALTAIAMARPALLGKITNYLLNLAKVGGFKVSESAGVGPETPGTEISVGQAVKNSLTQILKSRHQSSHPWRDRLFEALNSMGASAAAEACRKYIDRQDYKEARAQKHQRDSAGANDLATPDAKRLRASLPCPGPSAGSSSAATRPPAAQPMPGAQMPVPPPTQAVVADPRRALLQPAAGGPSAPPGYPAQQQAHIVLLPPPAAPPPAAPVLPGVQAAVQLHHSPALALQQAAAAAAAIQSPAMTAASASSSSAAASSSSAAMPPLTPQQEVQQLILILIRTLSQQDTTLLPTLLDSLCKDAPAVLVDLVMALMFVAELPSLEEVTERLAQANAAAAAAAGPEQQPAEAAAGSSKDAVGKAADKGAGSAQVVEVTVPGGLPSLAEMAKLLNRQLGSSTSHRRLPRGQAALPPLQVDRTAAQSAMVAALPPPAHIASAIAAGAPVVPPAPLSEQGVQMLCTAAIQRVAASSATLPATNRPLWMALLARLAAAAECGQPAAPAEQKQQPTDTTDMLYNSMLDSVMSDVDQGLGLDLGLNWLSSLLANQLTSPVQPASQPPAAIQDAAAQPLQLQSAADSEMAAEGASAGEEVAAPGSWDGSTGGAQQGGAEAGTSGGTAAGAMDVDGPVATQKGASGAAAQEANGTGEVAAGDAAAAGAPLDVDMADTQIQVHEGSPGGSGGSSGGGSAGIQDPLSGSLYETALLGLLDKLSQHGHLSSVRTLLSEAPALTVPGTVTFLRSLVALGAEAATAALAGARDIILHRPALRPALVDFVLETARDANPETRDKAVRLCCNQLVAVLNGALAPTIIKAAEGNLQVASSLVLVSMLECAAVLQCLLQPPPADEHGQQPTEWTMEEAARYCGLYATLCVNHDDLLPGLMHTYAKAQPLVRVAVMGASEKLAKALGHSNQQLVELVRDPIPGSEQLVWHMLEVLMSNLLPSMAMLDACRERYNMTGDVSCLVPMVGALTQAEVLQLLPQIIQVPGLNHKSLYRKLVAPTPSGEILFTPAELIVALHQLDPRRDQVSPKALIQAVDSTLHSPDIFNQQAIAQALQQMEASPFLPLLFMRSVITALKALPKLRKFIAELLSRLISRQIWLDPGQWRGFLLLIQDTGKPFYPLLLQLPTPVLSQVLGQTDPGAQQGAAAANEPKLSPEKALAFAQWALNTAENKTQLLSSVKTLLEGLVAAHQQQQQQQQSQPQQEVAQDAAPGAASEAAAPGAEAQAPAGAGPALVATVPTEPQAGPAAQAAPGPADVPAPAAAPAVVKKEDGTAHVAATGPSPSPEGVAPGISAAAAAGPTVVGEAGGGGGDGDGDDEADEDMEGEGVAEGEQGVEAVQEPVEEAREVDEFDRKVDDHGSVRGDDDFEQDDELLDEEEEEYGEDDIRNLLNED